MDWYDQNGGWLTRAAWWRPRRVDPLRVRVWLSSPVAWDDHAPITIEGALQFAVVLLETGRLPDDVFAGGDAGRPIRGVDIPIPIADEWIGGRRIACASWGIPAGCAVYSVRWRRKRTRVEALGLDKVMINGGAYKALNIPVGSLVTPWLDFYVRGDAEVIGRLLREVGGLGRDSTRGLGTILGFELDPDPLDRSLLFRGVPQRAIPLVMDGGAYDPRSFAADGWEERVCSTRAPYWVNDKPIHCGCPSLRIERDELALPEAA